MNEIDEIKKLLNNLKIKYPGHIHRYPENLKGKILKQCKIDGVKAISRLLDIHPSTIYGWITPLNKNKMPQTIQKNTRKRLTSKIDFKEISALKSMEMANSHKESHKITMLLTTFDGIKIEIQSSNSLELKQILNNIVRPH